MPVVRQKFPLICVTSASPNADCQIATAALFLLTSMSKGSESFFTTVSFISARARFALVQSLVSRHGSLVDATWIFLCKRSSLIPKPGLSRVLISSGMYLVVEIDEEVGTVSPSSLFSRSGIMELRMAPMTTRNLFQSPLLFVYLQEFLGQLFHLIRYTPPLPIRSSVNQLRYLHNSFQVAARQVNSSSQIVDS